MTGQLRWGDLLVDGDDRRRAIRDKGGNGIAGVEVHDGGRRLTVTFLMHVPRRAGPENIRIDAPPGGRPVIVRDVKRLVEMDAELEDRLVVELEQAGSPGVYRLRLVEPSPRGGPGTLPLRGLDPRFAEGRFVFDVDQPARPVPGAPLEPPRARRDAEPSYLARDYEGLRGLILDRLAVTLPEWTERHVPDLGITLVELFAAAGDELSYYQDAVATEAYLQTARRRTSIRRHARLTGYRVHNGCASRAWVCLEVAGEVELSVERLRFAAAGAAAVARSPLLAPGPALAEMRQFAPLTRGKVTLREAHNKIMLWSFGECDASLAAGATSAALVDGDESGRNLGLAPGDVLMLEQIHDPEAPELTLEDPARRHPVRLIATRRTEDELFGKPLLEVAWAIEDALPFTLPVRAAGAPCAVARGNILLVAHGARRREVVPVSNLRLSVPGLGFAPPFPDPAEVGRRQAARLRALYGAWRAEVDRWRRLAAYGEPLTAEQLELLQRQAGAQTLAELGLNEERDDDEGTRSYDEDPEAPSSPSRQARALGRLLVRADRLLARRRRRLEVLARLAEGSGPLAAALIDELVEDWGATLAASLAPRHAANHGPAAHALTQDPRAALPRLRLAAREGGRTWRVVPDLLASPGQRAVMAEIDDDGAAHLRLAATPPADTMFAEYWVGNGAVGNVPAGAIDALMWTDRDGAPTAATGSELEALRMVTGVRNPQPAQGGTDPEDLDVARLAVPGAYLDDQPRALAAADYARHASRVPGVRHAAAELRWTGTSLLADVVVVPDAGEDPSVPLLRDVERALAAVRRVDHAVRARAPRFRPLAIELLVTITPDAVRDLVAAELAARLGSGVRGDGAAALFHPARLGFGQPVYASAVIAEIQDAPSVTAVALRRFGFADEPPAASRPEVLTVGAMEVVRLDNDPLTPARGHAEIQLEGGR